MKALSANVDVFATILDLFGLKPESPVHGRSLLPIIEGKADTVRDWTLYGFFGRGANITDGKMTYLRTPRDSTVDVNIYSLCWEFERFKGNVPPIDDSLELGRFMRDVDMPVGRLAVRAGEIWSPDQWDRSLPR